MNKIVFKIGDIILRHIKGYPNWPRIIEKKTKKEEKEIKKTKYKVNGCLHRRHRVGYLFT